MARKKKVAAEEGICKQAAKIDRDEKFIFRFRNEPEPGTTERVWLKIMKWTEEGSEYAAGGSHRPVSTSGLRPRLDGGTSEQGDN